MDQIAVIREGSGPEILLVHGGASPRTTWGALAPLEARWTLAFVHRRGYPPSAPEREGRHDFDVDAEDLLPLLVGRPHLAAHSYGALGTLIAAGRRPDLVRSLTLIEPPPFDPIPEDPEIERFARIGDAVLTEGIDTEPVALREFLRIAGARDVDDGPLAAPLVDLVNRAHGARLPREARPDLDRIREAGVPVLVASGDHHPAVERGCDALALELGAERLVAPGSGHFVARASGFAEPFERFLASVE